MRKFLFILLAVLLLPCCMHQPQNGVRSLLKEAEGMIYTCPDTAYFLLREMEATMDLGAEADSAYHALLLLEAQVKNGVKLTDGTSVKKLMGYYRGVQDSLKGIRLHRLLAVSERDNGFYEEAAHAYRTAIRRARQMGDKRLLADMYQELAHLHYSAHLVLNSDFSKQFSEHLLALTIQTAKELKDSVLWMKSLIPPGGVAEQSEGMAGYERQLLQALDLAVALKDSITEADVLMFLSVVYGEKGEYEKVLPYVRRSLSLRQLHSSTSAFCLALGHAYQRIGMQDSAAYYLNKCDELKKQEELARLSTLSGRDGMDLTGMFVERLKQKGEQEREREQMYHVYALWWMLLSVAVVMLMIYFVRRSKIKYKEEEFLRKSSEELRLILKEEKVKLTEECQSIQMQLQQKEQALRQQRNESACRQQQLCEAEEQLKLAEEALQNEKEVLLCKEREIKSLQLKLDKFSSETGYVYDKVKQIIADFRHKDCSDLEMKETDWVLLQLAMDKQWKGAITRIQQEYQLSDMEMRLFCLHLMGVSTAHMLYFFGISRTNLYLKNQEMFGKIGVERTAATFKEDIHRFMKNWE